MNEKEKKILIGLCAATIISAAGLMMPFLINNEDISAGLNAIRTVLTIATFFFLYFFALVDAWKRFYGYKLALAFALIFFVPVVGTYCYFIFIMLPAFWKRENLQKH